MGTLSSIDGALTETLGPEAVLEKQSELPVTAAAARNLVRGAGLSDTDKGTAIALINTRPGDMLPLFRGLLPHDVKGTVEAHLSLLRHAQAPPVQCVGPSTSELQAAMREVLDDRLAASTSQPSVDFSRVGSTTAVGIYSSLGIALENGHQTEPLEEPPGGYPACGAFDMAVYPNKEAATADFLEHIKSGLGKQPGVVFGRSGFQVMDLHKSTSLYELRCGEYVYKGGLDGGILPFGVSTYQPAQQLRCAIMIQHSEEHKALYRERSTGQLSEGAKQGTQFSGTVQGQALLGTLAAFVFAEFPVVMLLLSCYDFNVIMELKAGTVTHWEDISFDAAIYKMGGFLRTCSPERRYCFAPSASSSLSQQDTEIVLRLRQKLRPANVLLEQLESLTAGDDSNSKFVAAMELFHAYRPSTFELGTMPMFS